MLLSFFFGLFKFVGELSKLIKVSKVLWIDVITNSLCPNVILLLIPILLLINHLRISPLASLRFAIRGLARSPTGPGQCLNRLLAAGLLFLGHLTHGNIGLPWAFDTCCVSLLSIYFVNLLYIVPFVCRKLLLNLLYYFLKAHLALALASSILCEQW